MPFPEGTYFEKHPTDTTRSYLWVGRKKSVYGDFVGGVRFNFTSNELAQVNLKDSWGVGDMRLECENCDPVVFPLQNIAKQRGTCPNLGCLKPYTLYRHGEVPKPEPPKVEKKAAVKPKRKRAPRKKRDIAEGVK